MNSEANDTEPHEARVPPNRIDEGRDVVGSNYRDIGTVTSVESNTIYVDPSTSLTEQVKRKLDWGGKRRTRFPITREFVERIDDDIVLVTGREEINREEVR